MQKDDCIQVQTESGKAIDVVVTSYKPEAIWVLVGEGPHSSKCKLEPTRNGLAYAGSIMGREIVYKKTVKEVRETIVRGAQEASSPRWKR